MERRPFDNVRTSSRKPKVLLIGGGDFLGAYLAELLLLRDCQVLMIDSLTEAGKKNLKKCFTNPNFAFLGESLEDCLKEIELLDYLFCLISNRCSLESVLALAKKTGAKTLLAGLDRSQEKPILITFQDEGIDVRIARLGFIYGPRMNLDVDEELTRLIKGAVKNRSLKIPGNGSTPVHPTFVSDVVYGLSKAMFSPGSEGRIFSLINPQGVSLFDFAQVLRNQSQRELQIEFVPDQERNEPFFSLEDDFVNQTELGWHPEVELSRGIEQTLGFFSQIGKSRNRLKRRKTKKSKKKRKIFSGRGTTILATAVFLFLLLVTYPFLVLLSNSLRGGRNLALAQKALLEIDFNRATKKAQAAQRSFRRASQVAQETAFAFDSLGLERTSQRLEKLLGVGDKVADSLVHAGLAAQAAAELGRIVLQNESGDVEGFLTEMGLEIEFAYNQLSLAEAEAKTEEDLLPIDISFPEIRQTFLKAQKMIKVAPEIVGLEGKRVYLILLQNNMELRPTGGFIGSYGLMTFDEGRLIDFEVEDVYAADGQLKGHVEPPEELKRYLGEAGWYLRDSNWHPDFSVSALRAEWFFEKETGRKVDGVVGLNLFLAQRILEQIGGVELVDFQEEIDHLNLFERAEYHAEAGFFPGSTQKKDFLASLTGAIFEKAKNSGEKTWLSLARAFYQSTNEKNLLVYLHSPLAMKVLAELGWDGRLKTIDCQAIKTGCLADYLMMVEANLGVNKANYFVKRDLTHQVEITSQGEVKEKLQVRYQNQSQSENFPAGRYKNFLRILVPQGTRLVGVTINGKPVEEEEISETEIGEKLSFGVLVEVPIQQERVVEIEYQLAERIDFEKASQYLLVLQKQPGIRDEVFNFWLTLPEEVKFFNPQPEASQSLNSLLFKPEFSQDIVFEVGLVK